MPLIYHIAPASSWSPDDGSYRGDTLDTQGFIHCSTADQLVTVANQFFHGRADLLVLVIDETRVRSEVIYENLEGGTDPFPHIYGPLNTEAVIDAFALTLRSDGTFSSAAELEKHRRHHPRLESGK